MSWFQRKNPTTAVPAKNGKPEDGEQRVRTEGLWLKCESCGEIIWKKDLEGNLNLCPKCGAHFRIDAAARLEMLLDGPYECFDVNLTSSDPLQFVDQRPYHERLKDMQRKTSLADALVAASGKLAGRAVQICAMEPKFIG